MVDTFLFTPTRESQRSNAPRVKQIAFGNGYKQVYSDGINCNLESWSLTFTETESVAILIDTFLKTAAGVTPFRWTSSGLGATEKYYLCPSWQVTPIGGCYWTITATFEEWAGLTDQSTATIFMPDDRLMPDDLRMT